MPSPKKLLSFVIIGALALIILGSMIDEAFFRTSEAQTPNVTGVSVVILSFIGLIFLIGVIMSYIGWL